MHGSYLEISNVELKYLNNPEPDLVHTPAGEPPVTFYRSWKVRAKTGERILEYVGSRVAARARRQQYDLLSLFL